MIRFPDRDPTGFCNSEPDRSGFRKTSTGSDMDIQTTLITAVKRLIITFFRTSTGLDQTFGQVYQISIGPDYSMKILDWSSIAKISDFFNTTFALCHRSEMSRPYFAIQS